VKGEKSGKKSGVTMMRRIKEGKAGKLRGSISGMGSNKNDQKRKRLLRQA